ncbi:RNA polymerase sigma factor [Pedobacter sp. L105]|uniref:RNA polymerase sigma factor n=1 Tax=Pedobacter sp. L105 TaxID=1641871 RepID=UPI00131B3EEE|nr:sigma-70 family RNA polymerase sigma factor [Pedobacter sp. L105]
MATPSSLDVIDKNMVTLFQQGNEDDYLKLYNKYAPAVLGVLTRTIGDQKLAEDCMHEAFFKIWSERLNYDPSKERLFTWMLKIAKTSKLYGALAKEKFLDDEIREGFDLVYACDLKKYLQEKQRTEGEQFAAGVDVILREAIRLIYFESYGFAAAAEKLNMSVENLRGEMVKTLKQLKGSVLS